MVQDLNPVSNQQLVNNEKDVNFTDINMQNCLIFISLRKYTGTGNGFSAIGVRQRIYLTMGQRPSSAPTIIVQIFGRTINMTVHLLHGTQRSYPVLGCTWKRKPGYHWP